MFVAGDDDGAAAAQAAKGGGGLHAEVPGLGGDQVANLVSLEIAPHVLDRIEFRSVGRKSFQDDASGGTGHVVLNHPAPVDRGAVPHDGQVPWDMPLQVLKELDDLRALDAPWVDLEEEPEQS